MNVQDPILRSLGRIVVNFSRVEAELELLIAILIPTQDIEACAILTTELSFKQRAALFMSLMIHHFNGNHTILKSAEDLIRKAMSMEEKRNTLMHSSWRVDDDGTIIRHKRTAKQKGLRRTDEKISHIEVNLVADAMKGMYEQLQAFTKVLATNPVPTFHGE
jgi:hypothetical protein